MFFLIGSYCACFASGLYCCGSCTCQDCRNTIANIFQVQNARKKVESHDPLAFAPNFTNMGTESSVNTMVIPQKNFHTNIVVSLLFLYSNILLHRTNLTVETLCRKMGPCRPQAHQGTKKAAIARRQSVCPDIVYASRYKIINFFLSSKMIKKKTKTKIIPRCCIYTKNDFSWNSYLCY